MDAVEAFRSKCEDTDIHSGIIVSGKGFTKNALTKAAESNIGCLTLDQVETFDWCLAPGIFVLSRLMIGYHTYVEFPDGTDLTGTLTDSDGQPFSKHRVGPLALKELDTNKELPATPGDHEVTIHYETPALYMSHGERRTRATRASVTIQYTVHESRSPFEFQKYFDVGRSTSITEAAIAPIKIGNKTAELVLSTETNGRISISLIQGPDAIPEIPKRGRKKGPG